MIYLFFYIFTIGIKLILITAIYTNPSIINNVIDVILLLSSRLDNTDINKDDPTKNVIIEQSVYIRMSIVGKNTVISRGSVIWGESKINLF